MNAAHTLAAMPVVLDERLTIEGPLAVTTISRRRNWWERLFSLPWEPWEEHRPDPVLHRTTVPNPNVLKFQGKLIMHPKTYQRLQAHIAGQ